MKPIVFISTLIISIAVIGPVNIKAEEAVKNASLIVGALEHHHIQWPDWGPSSFPDKEKKYKFQVRVLFKKRGASWVAFKHNASTPEELDASTKYYPKEINWFVAFNGKTLGQFRSTVPETVPFYADVGLHIPDPNAKLPTVGKFTKEFSGWLDEPGLRPLMLVSRNNTSDPQNWKPIQPPKPLLQNCVKEFKKNVEPVAFCDKQHGQKPTSNYADNLIHHFKSYESNDGQYLVSLQLEMSQNKCDEILSDAWAVSWFHVNKEGSIRYLGRGMILLDAGDYDNDGISEIVFWRNSYNEDGYVLFYNQFLNHVDFTWNYH